MVEVPGSAADAAQAPSASRSAVRFRTIDGLRGIAAMSVVIFHLHGAVGRAAPGWLPHWLNVVMAHGYYGVDVFFVISGFVIAYSVRNALLSGGFLARFAARRAIRLDPPYWLSIVIEIVLIVAGLSLFPELGTALPTPAQVLSHLVYAQNILGYGDIVPLYWTLCFEVQFYLFFVLLLILWSRLEGRLPRVVRATLPGLVLGSLFVASLITRFTQYQLPVPGIALLRWYEFFLGILVWWIVAGKARTRSLVLAWLAVAVVVIAADQSVVEFLPVVVSGFVLFAARRKKLESWLAGRTLQFLGAISYSLYLVHPSIGWRFVSLAQRLLDRELTPVLAWLVLLGGVAVSVATATAMWAVIERPSIALGRRIRLPTRQRAAASVPSPAGALSNG